MTMDDPDRIDIIARGPGGEIILAMVEWRDWSSDSEMVGQLSAKLRGYASFIKGPSYKQDYGDDPATIQLVTHHVPSAEAASLIQSFTSATGIPVEVEQRQLPQLGDVKLPPWLE